MINSDIANCFIDHNGFLNLRFHCKKKDHLDLKEAKILVENCIKVSDGISRSMLVECTELSPTVSLKAGEFFTSNKDLRKLIKATAVLISTLSSQLLAKFLIKLSQSERQALIFTDKKEAIEWLLTMPLNGNG